VKLSGDVLGEDRIQGLHRPNADPQWPEKNTARWGMDDQSKALVSCIAEPQKMEYTEKVKTHQSKFKT
jgi:hypothetical protein